VGYHPWVVPIAADEVRRIAALARIALEPAEVERFQRQLDAVLDHVARLEELDAEPAPPEDPAPADTALREDIETPGLTARQALSGAPDAACGHFRVPRPFGP